MKFTRTAVVALVAATALGVAGCSPSNQEESTRPSTTAASSAATEPSMADDAEVQLQGAGDIKLEDATVRAKAAADSAEGSDMTAVFGTIHNTSDHDITITGFSTSLGEADYQIHETVDGTMQQKEGGITIPAGGSDELAPGGDHLMIMGYAPEIAAGDTVDVFFETSDAEGGEQGIVVQGVAVRSMLPGGEEYGDGGEMTAHEHADSH